MGTLEDLFRLNAFHCIPGWGRYWLHASLEKKEYYTFTAAVPFLLGHIPLLLATFPVFFSVSFMASLGDASASFFGKRFGKHLLPNSPRKTWEGTLSGTLVTLATTLLWGLIFHPQQIAVCIVFAGLLAGLFSLFDALNHTIDDNFINTFVIGAIAWGLYVLLF